MSILASILVLFLTETLGRPLPQTIREVEQWTRNLTPEERQRFIESKKAAKTREKEPKLGALAEEVGQNDENIS